MQFKMSRKHLSIQTFWLVFYRDYVDQIWHKVEHERDSKYLIDISTSNEVEIILGSSASQINLYMYGGGNPLFHSDSIGFWTGSYWYTRKFPQNG